MSDVALKFLFANIAAAVAILLVIALRKPARTIFGARLAYSLWLLVPLAALGSLLPPRIVEIARPAPTMSVSYPPPSFAPDFLPAPPVVAPAETSVLPPAPSPDLSPPVLSAWTLDPVTLGIVVWFAGAFGMAIWLLRGQLRFLADARAGFAGPAVAGVFNPRIITPADFEDRFEKSERDVIIAHEKIHLANNDARINAVVALLRCLCWFNPLVHVAAHLMRVDQELACDATVVERHPRAKAVYASALLKAQLAARPLPLGCYWPAGTEHPLTERVEMLKQAKPTRLRRHVGIAALALLTLGAGATAWAVLPPEEHIRFDAPAAPATPAPAAVATAPAGSAPLTVASDAPAPPPALQAPPTPEEAYHLDEPVYLRGKVEKIDFGADTYVAYVRASSVARDRVSTEQPDTRLWRLSPMNYWGDREAVTRDLVNETVNVEGFFRSGDTLCDPYCAMKATSLVKCAVLPTFAPGCSRTPDAATLPSPQPIRYEPQQTPGASPVQPPMAPVPPRNPGFLDTPSTLTGSGTPSPARLDAGVPIYLRGKIERLEFGASSYVVFLRAAYVSNYNSGRGQERPPESSAMTWALSPTNYFGDRASITEDLVGKEVEAHGVNVNSACKPDCRLKVTRLLFGEPSEVPPLVSSERLISQFARWYDTDAPNMISGNVERLAFHGNGRTFDAYVRSDARGAVPSRLFQVRSEYHHPQGDIERALAGKRVNVFGWRARETAGTFCAPVCGVFGDYFTVLDASGSTENITPDGPALTTPIIGRNVVAASISTQNNGYRIVALKRERLQLSSRDIEKFVDRDFEPGEEHYLFPGNDWTISTPNGAAFELRFRNTSLGPLADAGAVKAQSVDAIAPSSELYEAIARRDDAQTKYGEKHPEWQKADALVRELLQRRKPPPR